MENNFEKQAKELYNKAIDVVNRAVMQNQILMVKHLR